MAATATRKTLTAYEVARNTSPMTGTPTALLFPAVVLIVETADIDPAGVTLHVQDLFTGNRRAMSFAYDAVLDVIA